MTYTDRYASAKRSSNLRSKADTTQSDSDVLGAAGLAAKRQPLAMALLSLFVGDNRAAKQVVLLMADMLVGKAWHWEKVSLERVEAEDMARKVLAWHRDGVCRVCGGHGFQLQSGGKPGQGRDTLSDRHCTACRGTGRIPFDGAFSMERTPLARWLLSEVERETAKAGPAAMQALAPRLDLP